MSISSNFLLFSKVQTIDTYTVTVAMAHLHEMKYAETRQ